MYKNCARNWKSKKGMPSNFSCEDLLKNQGLMVFKRIVMKIKQEPFYIAITHLTPRFARYPRAA